MFAIKKCCMCMKGSSVVSQGGLKLDRGLKAKTMSFLKSANFFKILSVAYWKKQIKFINKIGGDCQDALKII